MYHFGRSVRGLFRQSPHFPPLKGTAFVFGGAPDPVVPKLLLDTATIITANASQVYLEQFGVTKPDITLMRSNMDDGKNTSGMKLAKLEGRETGLLIMFGPKSDPECLTQRKLLEDVGYRHDELLTIDRLDNMILRSRLLDPKAPSLLWEYQPSLGLQAVLMALTMGSTDVAVSGVSFRSGGCSYSDMKYDRIHVKDDLSVIRRINKFQLPVFAVEEHLAEDTGLRRWQQNQAPSEAV